MESISMRTMEATPTEYKGVVYRSKCEAMFALHLDTELDNQASIRKWLSEKRGKKLLNLSGGFEYEPSTLIDGWHPDFLLWEVLPPSGFTENEFFHQLPTMECCFVEYKPSRPTKAYINNYISKYMQWRRIAETESLDFASRCTAKICYGSPYSKNRESDVGEILVFHFGEYCDVVDDWGANDFEYALNYRFDLVQSCHE
jgi:hypothetical protein